MGWYTRLPSIPMTATEPWPMRSSSLLGSLSHEHGEGLIEHEESHTSLPFGERWRAIYRVTPRRYGVLGGSIILTILLFILSLSRGSYHDRSDVPERRAQTLRLILPVSDISSDLCRTILSAQVLQYSTPTLVRWDAFGRDTRENAQRRMTAVRNYLATLVDEHGNDTVMLLDGAKTWFQLRPEVLIKRYYEMNRRVNDRLAASIGLKMMRDEAVRQSVVFSSTQECGTVAGDVVGYSDAQEPPNKKRASHSRPPGHISQDLVMGTVTDLHAIYQRSVSVIEQDPRLVDELAVLSEVLRIQEHNRALLASRNLSWSQHFRGWMSGIYSHGPLIGKEETGQSQRHAEDLGIGLDNAGELSMGISKRSDSFAFVQHEDIPADIAYSMSPFWTTTGESLSHKAWSDLNLLTHTQTHAVPALVHSLITDDPSARRGQWRSLWFQPFSRRLLDASMSVPVMPLAAAVDNDSIEQVFWSTTTGEKAGVKDTDGTWYGWEDICKGDELAEELFGDGVGEWKPAQM